MKKLLLAPAVAIALSGFVAVPALATGTVGEFAASAGSSLQTTNAGSQPAPAPTTDPHVLVSPEVTPADLANQNVGVTVLISNAEPGSTANDSLTASDVEVDAAGNASWQIYSSGVMEAGDDVPFTITYTPAGGESTTVNATFSIVEAYTSGDPEPTPPEDPEPTTAPDPTVTPDPTPSDDNDDAAVEYALTVNPQEISPADFVNEDKGVELLVDGLAAGETVEFSVTPSGSNVTPLTQEATADESGTAVWGVHGTNAGNPSLYLGTYTVTVSNEAGDTLTDSFTVTNTPGEDGNADDEGNAGGDGGKDEKENGDGGSDLPRTGAELGGLAAGAALLTVGAATVLLTRRRAAKA